MRGEVRETSCSEVTPLPYGIQASQRVGGCGLEPLSTVHKYVHHVIKYVHHRERQVDEIHHRERQVDEKVTLVLVHQVKNGEK